MGGLLYVRFFQQSPSLTESRSFSLCQGVTVGPQPLGCVCDRERETAGAPACLHEEVTTGAAASLLGQEAESWSHGD